MFLRITLILFAFAAHIPILWEYCLRMWRAEHYQFFPILIFGVAWYLWTDKDEIFQGTTPTRDGYILPLFALVGFVALLATTLNSSFLAAVSLWCLSASTALWIGGIKGFKRCLPLLLLLLLIVPLPARLDQRLIFYLQFAASHLASLILDGAGLIHFREGVILITESEQFLTEEACSGIRSLFSSLAGMGFYCLVSYYSLWRYAFNFVQTLFWVVAGNALRIAFIVFVSENYSNSIAVGVGHELTGFIGFAFIMLMAFCTDRLLQSLLPRSDYDADVIEDETSTNGDSNCNERPFEFRNRVFEKVTIPAASPALISIFTVVFVLGSVIFANKLLGENGAYISKLPRLSKPVASDLVCERWEVQEFENVQRASGGIQAQDSSIWTLSLGDLSARFSLDCPWDDWHDLSNCYSALGWNVDMQHSFDDGGEAARQGFSVLRMSKSTGEMGIVFFSSVDKTGTQVVPRFTGGYFSTQSVYRQAVDTVADNLGLQNDELMNKGIVLPVTTFQLVCEPNRDIAENEFDQLRNLFFECRDSLLKSKRFGSGN